MGEYNLIDYTFVFSWAYEFNSWDLFPQKYTFNYDFNNFVSFYNELFNQNQNQGMETMILIIHFYTV